MEKMRKSTRGISMILGKVKSLKEWIKRKRNSCSLKVSFAVYMVGGLLAALCLSIIFSVICQSIQDQIRQKYEKMANREPVELFYEDGVPTGTSGYVYLSDPREFYSDWELTVDEAAGILAWFLPFLSFCGSIVVTSILFYKRNLKKPLELLDEGAEKIAQQDLDFSITYERENELGRLCGSFEEMRRALLENNREMWRQMEERRRLNAAFSHDMRTPLTVLEGQSEMLIKYAANGQMPREKIVSAARTMHGNIKRLEEYVAAMNQVQRLDDLEVTKTLVTGEELCKRLEESGKILCKSLDFSIKAENIKENFQADLNLVEQVYQNLLANAVRYGKKKIQAEVKTDQFLVISVQDDGGGFSEESLEKAAEPFYQGKERKGGQFGMGLYICRILCEKCKGSLTLKNTREGACVTARFLI